MTPEAFISKWKASTLKERSAAQEHFIDLCHMLGEPTPSSDPSGTSYCFEKGALKTTGSKGWADVWKRGHFGWEYKGKGADLHAAFAQLQKYAVALENPPLLVVCDLERFRIHTSWNNTVSTVHELTLEDLRDPAKRQVLKAVLSDPEKLRPGLTRQALTEHAASDFARLAQRLREAGHPPIAVAHFIQRLVFSMFAEDVGLLPDQLFSRMLLAAKGMPGQFEVMASELFRAMRSGGTAAWQKIDWFNGGLFDDDTALPLDRDDIQIVSAAAALDWAEIDPTIFGTLFERGLDPGKRSQLGAHYTDRDKIMLIIEPVIIRPLLAEWEITKTAISDALVRANAAKTAAPRTKARDAALSHYRAFLYRLRNFKVLDPACGSGNFLYLALLALKDLEQQVMIEAETIDPVVLPREFPHVGPAAVKGIEINSFAAELARVTVWIGEIQWMRRNGWEVSRNPILKTLDNIECRDAILDADGSESIWPDADVIVGNPPFIGGKMLRRSLGDEYVDKLFRLFSDRVPSEADFVTYWFEKARGQIANDRTKLGGLVATNSIRGAFNRRVLERVAQVAPLFEAWSDEPWDADGVSVRVSIVCFGEHHGSPQLNGLRVPRISADLSASASDLTLARRLPENAKKCFQGPVKVGPFEIDGEEARQLLTARGNPNGQPNSDVVRPWSNGMDLVRRPLDKWIVDFGERKEKEASLYEAPFAIVESRVKPIRILNRDRQRRDLWWRLGRSGGDLRVASADLHRVILTPRVSKHRIFVWRPVQVLPDSRVVVIAKDDNATFGILHSRFHEAWSLRLGGWHGAGNDPVYTPSLGFETFPFPEGLTPDLPAKDQREDLATFRVVEAAVRLDELRSNWLNPPDLVRTEPEVCPGYPARVMPINEDAEEVLRRRTLTNLYNASPAWLRNAHSELDQAVAAVYEWPEDITTEEALARLLELNELRSHRGLARKIASVASLRTALRQRWKGNEAINLCIKVIDYLDSTEQTVARLEFSDIAEIVGKDEIDGELIDTVSMLTSGSIRPLEPRLNYKTEDIDVDIDPRVQYESLSPDSSTTFLEMISRDVGKPISELEKNLFPFFVPSSLFYRLRMS